MAMTSLKPPKFSSIAELCDYLPSGERLIVDVLRQIVRQYLPSWCKEKISFNVPYFYGHKGICIIWPAAIPRGGITEGVLLGFWRGNRLSDEQGYLTKGANKKIFYRIYTTPEEIDETAIARLLQEAVRVDQS